MCSSVLLGDHLQFLFVFSIYTSEAVHESGDVDTSVWGVQILIQILVRDLQNLVIVETLMQVFFLINCFRTKDQYRS